MTSLFLFQLFSRITPTPWVPFTVQRRGAAVGVIVTASHNPKEDNGYKVYWSNGCQIKSPHDFNIQESILANQAPFAGADTFNDDLPDCDKSLLEDPLSEINEQYFSALEKGLFNKTMNENFDKKIVYSAMHGVGADYVETAFRTAGFSSLVHVQEQKGVHFMNSLNVLHVNLGIFVDPDPTFPTVRFPNPEEGKSALDMSMKTAAEINSIYILANDPDADRLAIAEKIDK